MPLPVLERAREELLSTGGSGMSVMEMSHRSTQFGNILAGAEHGLRELLGAPDNFKILFLQGGAAFQFSMIPMNFLRSDQTADYVVTGYWGGKAVREARRCGAVNVIYSGEESGYRSIPDQSDLRFSPDATYVHYTSNETIDGVEFKYDLDAGGVPVICDAYSNILSKPFDLEKYALMYAGAQKNIGPSGVTVVIIRDDMLDRVPADQHALLDYRNIAENGSLANTPNTWGIYIIGLVCEWLKEQGGITAMQKLNQEKAELLYKCIDSSDGFYQGHSKKNCRSLMNVTFRMASPELDEQFCSEAEAIGLDGLRGHRSVGGIRASIYNAFPKDGVETLVDFMADFAARNG
jgi:phosphoserine aminotransferase